MDTDKMTDKELADAIRSVCENISRDIEKSGLSKLLTKAETRGIEVRTSLREGSTLSNPNSYWLHADISRTEKI